MTKDEIRNPEIIFIMGIMPRSGTHFLANLLCHHPDCSKSVIPEDGLVARADFLTQYINQLLHVWEANGDLQKVAYLSPKELLFESFGTGLTNFLIQSQKIALSKNGTPKGADNAEELSKRLVTKTPQVLNIDKFFKLFPNQKLLILIRDGRALVESINKSFNYPREEAIRDWADSARRIFKFEKEQFHNKDKYLIIKYEDLHFQTEKEMRKVLEFLKLDPESYDFHQSLNLPVVGSSVFKRGDGEVNWLPAEKNSEFKPLERAANWTRAEHERFNWLAKTELIKMGYEPTVFSGNKLGWKVWNNFQDFRWQTLIWHKRFNKFLRFVIKRFSIYFGK